MSRVNEEQREIDRVSRELKQAAESVALMMRNGHNITSIEAELCLLESSVREARRLLSGGIQP